MIAFKDIIPTVLTELEEIDYFASEEDGIVVEDGTKEAVIEKALRDRGFVIVIAPIMRAPKKDSQAALAIVRAEIFIIVQVNPKVNEKIAQRDIYTAVQKIVQKLKGYTGVNPNDRFDIADDAIELSSFDPGLWAYDLTFTKQAAF